LCSLGQEVIALVEGDEARVASFLKSIKSKKPELTEPSMSKDMMRIIWSSVLFFLAFWEKGWILE
jgi:hypothetical protein